MTKLTQRQLNTLCAVSNLHGRGILPSELAKVTGVHRLMVMRWLDDGLLPYELRGRHRMIAPQTLQDLEIPERQNGPKLSRDEVRLIRRRQRLGETKEQVYADYADTVGELAFTRVWKGRTFKNVG